MVSTPPFPSVRELDRQDPLVVIVGESISSALSFLPSLGAAGLQTLTSDMKEDPADDIILEMSWSKISDKAKQ